MAKKIRISVTPTLRQFVNEAYTLERNKLIEMRHNPDDMTPGFYPAELFSVNDKFKSDVVHLSDRETAVLREMLYGYAEDLEKRTQLLCVPDTYIAKARKQLDFVNKLLEKLSEIF